MKRKRPDIRKQLERMIKTPREIALLKRSAKITDSCIAVLERELRKEDATERQVAAAIDRNIRRHGAGLAFPTIVSCRKRGLRVHGKPTRSRVRGLGYADFGAKWKGYCTDITVPFAKGEINTKERHMLDTAILAYAMLTKSVRLGMPCWKLQEKFTRFLRGRGYGVFHSLGHGIGLDIHEMPSITMPRRRRKKLGPVRRKRARKRWNIVKRLRFEPGMAFTIEPGVYVEGVGGCRYENDFLLTKRGLEAITHAKPLIIS
ncbi:MAG: Xaa-Pro peptidase family protein [Candidatus Aenigmatarchaeota archaeon]